MQCMYLLNQLIPQNACTHILSPWTACIAVWLNVFRLRPQVLNNVCRVVCNKCCATLLVSCRCSVYKRHVGGGGSIRQYVPSFSNPSVMCSKDRKTNLFHCPVCLFQTGQADRPFSRSCLPVPSVRHRRDMQTGHFHCRICDLSSLSCHVLVRPLWPAVFPWPAPDLQLMGTI